jgi:putative tricarboxylic transport membrane protein
LPALEAEGAAQEFAEFLHAPMLPVQCREAFRPGGGMPQTRGWQAALACLLAMFAFFALESLALSLRDALGPGPGFFPFWLSLIGAALVLFLFLQLARGQVAFETAMLKFELRSVALVLGGLVVATALLEAAGFRLAMIVLLPYLLVVLGARNWLAIGLFSAAGSFGVYHLFSGALKVPLP